MTEQPAIDYDYGISKVHYDKAHKIDRVMVHQVEGRKVQPGREWSRADVVNRIGMGDRFVTLPELNRSRARFGQTVEVWGKEFIRSIPNGTASDNLESLPRILTFYGISKVRYDCAHAHIETVMVHKVECQQICCEGCEWRRLDVVHRLKEGDSFITLPKPSVGKALSGQTVEVWHKKFLRTTPSGKDPDNLENLPRIPGYSYGISKVHYDRAHTHIDSVMVHSVTGPAKVCSGCQWRARDVVYRIKEGDHFVTLPRRTRSEKRSGQTVRVYGKKFIRSIPNGIAHDNLLRLPRLRVF